MACPTLAEPRQRRDDRSRPTALHQATHRTPGMPCGEREADTRREIRMRATDVTGDASVSWWIEPIRTRAETAPPPEGVPILPWAEDDLVRVGLQDVFDLPQSDRARSAISAADLHASSAKEAPAILRTRVRRWTKKSPHRPRSTVPLISIAVGKVWNGDCIRPWASPAGERRSRVDRWQRITEQVGRNA